MSHKAILQAPAIRALTIQLGAFLSVVGLAHGVSLLSESQMTIAVAVLLQGVIASSLSRMFGLAPWWLAIQAAFPIALVAMLSLHLPSHIFLVGFVALLGLYWSAFRTQVPFYPSGPAAWKAVKDLLPKDRPIRFVDIGSGLGGLVLHLSEMRKESEFAGIEIAPLPWLVSALRSRMAGVNARFIRGDYDRVDFASYDVVFAYLSPAAMPSLWRKASSEMRAGSLLLSYEFAIPAVKPHLTIAPDASGPPLYGWYM